ncbi:MAG TPA: alpha-amylase/4-alpha-glucanotransferase domain-containing protein [Terriglobia bacterium]|nr:alpha-amylase/4-alpha-glucanotransferase domain-containing protein [Terriglobia bacterium]
MAHRVSFCMVIHSHQPVGNFDHVIEDAFQKSYHPFLVVLSRHPRVRLSLHYSGILLEWLESHHPEFIRLLREMTDRGQVEHVGGGFYEPILASIPDAEKVTQIRRQSDFLRQHFGAFPQGLWLTERVWEQGLISPLIEAGIRYTILDDTHFLAAGLEPGQLHQAFLTEETGLPLTLVPSLQALRYTMPFRDPEETLTIFRGGSHEEPALFAVGDDCEKFGVWPGTYDHCYSRGWLERFFQVLEEAGDWLEVTTVSDYLARCRPTKRVYLPTASYAEMMTWALPAPAAAALEDCFEEATRMPRGELFRRFLRGGQWRNFLSKYPESNQMQKLTLRACQRWRRLRRIVAAGTDEDQRLAAAQSHLLAAQCNDAYWHGIFGGLYAPHLRSAVLGHLIEAETLLDSLDPQQAVRADRMDFDVDGRQEILIDHPAFGLVARSGEGGTVSSLRFKPARAELVNSLMRRPEAYHKQVRQQGNSQSAPADAPASIHDRVRSKESNLADLLHYDRYPRHGFRTYLFPPGKSWQDFENLHLDECAELARGEWKSAGPAGEPGAFSFEHGGSLMLGHHELQIEARKAFKTGFDDSCWLTECDLKLSSCGTEAARCGVGMELVFNLLAPKSPDRYFQAAGSRHSLEFRGEIPGSELLLADEWQRLEISLSAPGAGRWWITPIETISQSESGFERVYQGSAILPVWEIELGGQKEAACVLSVQIRQLG